MVLCKTKDDIATTTMVITFWDYVMFYQKWKEGRLLVINMSYNWEISGQSQNFIEI